MTLDGELGYAANHGGTICGWGVKSLKIFGKGGEGAEGGQR